MKHTLIKTGMTVLLSLLLSTAHASESAKSEGAGAYVRLEAVTVNLAGSNQFVRAEFTLKLADPAAGETIKYYMPVVRHELIMLVSSKTAEQLTLLEGKQKLIQETKDTLNRALNLKSETGISSILIESLIIQ